MLKWESDTPSMKHNKPDNQNDSLQDVDLRVWLLFKTNTDRQGIVMLTKPVEWTSRLVATRHSLLSLWTTLAAQGNALGRGDGSQVVACVWSWNLTPPQQCDWYGVWRELGQWRGPGVLLIGPGAKQRQQCVVGRGGPLPGTVHWAAPDLWGGEAALPGDITPQLPRRGSPPKPCCIPALQQRFLVQDAHFTAAGSY